MGRSVIVRPSGLAVIDAVGSSGAMRLLQGLPRFCLGAAARSLQAGRNAQMVNLMRLEAGTETVIDVHHRNAARAGIEHGKKRGQTTERSAVANACGNRDNRARNQARHHAGQRALHAGNRDDHLSVHQGIHIGEQAMQAGNAHVVHAHNLVAQGLRRKRSLLGHRKVAGARSGHNDEAVARGGRKGTNDADT